MEKWVERQRKAGQRHAGEAGVCLEGEGKVGCQHWRQTALKEAAGFG